MPLFDVTTIGETMIRFSPPAGQPVELSQKMDVYAAGSESNVLSALSQMGYKCGWHSSLPINSLGRFVANQLRLRGVDLSQVIWREQGRVGTFFVDIGISPRPTHVIYDRQNSLFSSISSCDIDWDNLLNTRLLHLTGITPALSDKCEALVIEAVDRAKHADVPISFDVNFREKLWNSDEAAKTLIPILKKCHLIFCAKRDAERLFNCSGSNEVMLYGLAEMANGARIVLSAGADGAFALEDNEIFFSPARKVTIVDPLGAGDALAAGVLHGWLSGSLAEGLTTGVRMSGEVLAQPGDMLVVNSHSLELGSFDSERLMSR